MRTAKGRLVEVERTLWKNMLMRGEQKPTPLPMQLYPFSLVRIVVTTPTGEPVYRQPLWLLVMGEQRQRLTLADIHQAYSQRFDQEHFLRFAKQRLLLTSFQTPDTPQEEHWLRLVNLAYFQLWLARPLAQAHLRPWERYLPNVHLRPLTPTLVLRSFAQIIRRFGTPATTPKPRGYSTGRRKGVRLTPRPRLSVVRKRPKRSG